jgi:hypothetical protein
MRSVVSPTVELKIERRTPALLFTKRTEREMGIR